MRIITNNLAIQLFYLALLIFSQASFAKDDEMRVWSIKKLSEAPFEKIKLEDKRGRVIKTIDVKQMVYIYSVMTVIVEVAEVYANLILVEGKDPNAFAAKGKVDKNIKENKSIKEQENIIEDDIIKQDENVVGINFAMLDLLGLDVNAIAGIIGHELAHLKLNHGEESEEAQKNKNSNSMITAADTKYSRDNEREADYLGVIWAVESGYDPSGAVRIHEQLYKLSKRRVGGFVGSHPSSIERITILKSLVRRLSK